MVVRSRWIGLSVARLQHLDLGRDGVARAHGLQEPPVDLEEHAAGAGEVLGDDGVQQAGGDAALHDDPAEAGRRGELRVVVERVAIAGHLGEQLDVTRRHRAGPAGGGADAQCGRGWRGAGHGHSAAPIR